jgi:hypothetical protein
MTMRVSIEQSVTLVLRMSYEDTINIIEKEI